MKRKKPSFNEGYHGYRTFSELLEDAQAHDLIEISVDSRSGTYVISGFGMMKKKKVGRKRGPQRQPTS